MSQALARWLAQHGVAREKLFAAWHAHAKATADTVGGRILSLDAMKSWQRYRSIEQQQRPMSEMSDAAVRPYCESLSREFERADMNFSAQWEALPRPPR